MKTSSGYIFGGFTPKGQAEHIGAPVTTLGMPTPTKTELAAWVATYGTRRDRRPARHHPGLPRRVRLLSLL